jgi:hypothetical protein
MMRLFSVDNPDHAYATEILPWYVNGTLEPVEHSRVERHVAECAACRAELGMLHELEAVVQAEGAEVPVAESLERMHSRLSAHASPAPARSGWLRRQWTLTPLAARAVLVTQCLFVVALAGALGALDHSPPAAYRTLASPPSVAKGEDLLVVFDEATTQGALRELLQRVHARVVDGPNSAGALSMRVPPGELGPALRELRASPYVRLVEPAGSGASTGP